MRLEIEIAIQIEEQVPKDSNGQEKASVYNLHIIQFVACCIMFVVAYEAQQIVITIAKYKQHIVISTQHLHPCDRSELSHAYAWSS